MGVGKRIASAAVRGSIALLGRRNVYRLGRLMVNSARLDVPNDPGSNGETLVQQIVLAQAPSDDKIVVFDVGANLGEWTRSFMLAANGRVERVTIHAFEPCSGTYALLTQRIAASGFGSRVVAVQKACSANSGTAVLNVVGVGYGTNSLVAPKTNAVEQVLVISIDDYCQQEGIATITLLKIDAEGHDFEVIRGAALMLQRKAINTLQFEYNHRWVLARNFLRDAFEFLQSCGYSVGKITPAGIEFYMGWSPELETFCEGNYIACLPEGIAKFPRVAASWVPALTLARNGGN